MENDWNEHKLLVMSGLNEIKDQNTAIRADIAALKTDVAVLKVKAGFWGFVAGAVGMIISNLLKGGH